MHAQDSVKFIHTVVPVWYGVWLCKPWPSGCNSSSDSFNLHCRKKCWRGICKLWEIFQNHFEVIEALHMACTKQALQLATILLGACLIKCCWCCCNCNWDNWERTPGIKVKKDTVFLLVLDFFVSLFSGCLFTSSSLPDETFFSAIVSFSSHTSVYCYVVFTQTKLP